MAETMLWMVKFDLTKSRTTESSYPTMAIGPDGVVHVAWRGEAGVSAEIYYRSGR